MKQPGTAVGRQILERLRTQPDPAEEDALAALGPKWASSGIDTAYCNIRSQGPGLLGRIEARAKELQPVLQANQAALARYDAAVALPGFFEEERTDPRAMLPFGAATKAACLARSELAPRLLRGERDAEARFTRHVHYWLTALQQSHGWVDLGRHVVPRPERLFTWWSYRAQDWAASNRGRRLDHVWLSPSLLGAARGLDTLVPARGWQRPSDHVPLVAELDL